MVAKAFKEVIINEKNQRNHIGMLTQVKVVLFAVISATSYYRFLSSTPFEIARGIYGHHAHAKMQAYTELIWHVRQCVHNEEARGVSIPRMHSSLLLFCRLVAIVIVLLYKHGCTRFYHLFIESNIMLKIDLTKT